jgi:exosortase
VHTYLAPDVAAPAQTDRGPSSIWRNGLVVLTLAALWFVLCRHLSAEWRYNEQYSYGWFVPFFALYIFWLRWEERPRARGQRSEIGGRRIAFLLSTFAFLLLLLLLPLRIFEIANPGWRPLDWLHTFIVATLTLLAIWVAGGKPWLRQFAFPIGFFFVALPWFGPIEEPIVQGLMRGVAAIVSEMMNLLGIPAQFEGSVIRVNAGLVGVSEACSGVRSLQTSLMIGLLFGELNRLTNSRRLLLLVATIALALVANVMRTFLLVWLAATRGLSSMERGHDVAGYAVLLIVFAGAIAIARWMSRRSDMVGTDRRAVRFGAPGGRALPDTVLIFSLAWILFVEIASEGWYRWHEHELVPQAQWNVRWPNGATAVHDIHLDEHTRRMLRFDQGRGVSWRSASPSSASNLLYFFRWKPGHNSALLAALHRPDVCLPATGWKQTADLGVRYYSAGNGLRIPFRHFEFLQRTADGREQFAHAFYCLWEDRVRRIGDSTSEDEEMKGGPSDWSRTERVRLVIEGRRHLGQQVMEFLMASPAAITAEDAEVRFAEKIRELIVATR